MGIAAYNRGSKVIRQQIDQAQPSAKMQLMEELNALPRHEFAERPHSTIHFNFDAVHNCWWAECPITGYGYFYRTLRQAVAAWRVDIVAYRDGNWIAEPQPRN